METSLVGGRLFSQWLSGYYYQEERKPPSKKVMIDVIENLEARAINEGEEKPVHLRIAMYDGKIFLDLANARRQIVEIGCDGWSIIVESPIAFRCPNSTQALPCPEKEGSAQELGLLLNIESDEDLAICIGWLIATLRPIGPYPILLLNGEQGSAKSSMARILKSLVDPQTAVLRTTPKNVHDLRSERMGSRAG